MTLHDEGHETLYWIRFVTLAGQALLIFGETPPLTEALAEERTHYPATMSPDDIAEFAYAAKYLIDNRQQGLLFGRWYSVVEPQGELGSTHINTIDPITKQAFQEAKACSWQPSRAKAPTLIDELTALLTSS